MLLEAAVPRFWLPANRDGFDALHYAAKSRACVKLVSPAISSWPLARVLSSCGTAAWLSDLTYLICLTVSVSLFTLFQVFQFFFLDYDVSVQTLHARFSAPLLPSRPPAS